MEEFWMQIPPRSIIDALMSEGADRKIQRHLVQDADRFFRTPLTDALRGGGSRLRLRHSYRASGNLPEGST
jgi:hypothetical protein